MRKFYLVFTVVLLLFSAAYAQSTAPVITSFTPVAGTYRDTIIIKGSGLLETNGVFFGGIRSGYLRLVNDSILYAGVPLGKTGDVTVETSFGTAVKSGFTYILPLVVAFSPLYGPPGTTVTITGGPFNIDPAENIVHFGAVQTTAVTASKDTLTAVIPTGANSAMIRVQANGSGGYSKDHFLVTLPGEDLTNHFSFSAPVNMDDLYNVKGIGAADFDGDGKPDVATINQSTSVVSVYKNSSTLEEIGFTPKIDLAAGGIPVELITGDVDVDGKPDIIMKINQPNKLVVLRNTSSNGVISFASPVSFTAITFIGFPPFYGRTMAMRDIDGDGKPEIISANSSDHTFTVFRNTGSAGIISFATPYDVPCDNNPSAIIIEDFDGDSKADVIVLSSGSWFSTFRNTSSAGNISFTSTVVGGEASSTVFSLTAGDYDADGKVDLAVVTIVTRQLTIFRNTSSSGAISFAPRVERPLAYYPNYLEHGDFDGDGKKDWLVLSQNNRSSLSISRNLSSSGSIATGFSQDFSAGFWPAQSIVADLNGDGKPDIITTEYNGRGTYFFRNTLHDPGIQSFAPMTAKKGDTVIVKGWNFASAVQVRFGGVLAMSFTVLDDSTIVAVVGQGGSGKIVVTNSAGSGTKSGFVFGIPPVIISFSPLSGPAASTVIIKGKHFGNTISDNTVLIGGARAIISTASDTALTVIVPSGAAYYPITVTNSDSLTAYSEQRFGLTFPGAMDTLVAQATFTHRLSLNAADQTLHLKQADLNGDGKNDLICASSNGHELRIYQNTSINGVLSFAPPLNYNIAFPNNLVIDDVNGDGKADIVMATTGNGITIIQNTSIGESLSFQEVSVSAGYPLFRLGIRDLDGDGKTDLVTTGFVSGVTRLSIYRNVSIGGNISFESPVFYDINILFSFCHLIEDVNKDGKPDICVQALSGQIDTLYIFNNMSQPGTLSFVKGKGLPIGERGSFNMVAGDLDGDTLPDFVKGNRSASAKSLAILPNKSSNGVIDFDPLVTVNAGHLPQYLAISDVDGDGQPDIATINDTSNAVSFFRNKSITGSMVFAGNTELPSGSSPVAFFFGGLDGDGKPDLAVVKYSVDSI